MLAEVWRTKSHALLLLAILVLALVLRVFGLGREDYWLDELHSMANSAGKRAELEAVPRETLFSLFARPTELDREATWASVWRTMRHDSHPPLYFLTLHVWRSYCGDSEAAVRTLSVLFSVLSIIPLVVLLSGSRAKGQRQVRYTHGESPSHCSPYAGLGAGLLLALASSHIWMGQENRPYSLAIFWTSCSFCLLLRGENQWQASSSLEKSRFAVLYGACVYLGLLTHYFTILAFFSQAIYALCFFRGNSLRWWLATSALTGAAFSVTWGPTLLGQLDFIRNQPWLLEETPDHFWKTVARFCDLPARLLIRCEPFKTNLLRSTLGVLLFGGCAFLAWRRHPRLASLFGLWVLVPATSLASLDIITDKQLLSHLRYSAIVTPGVAGLLSLAIGDLRLSMRCLLWPALITTMLLRLNLPVAQNPHARDAAARLRTWVGAQDLVIYDAVGWPDVWLSHLFVPISYYWPEQVAPVILLHDPPNTEVQARVQTFPRIIVVSPRVDAIPHPAAATHQLTQRTDYIFQIGWIYEFVVKRSGSQPSEGK